MRLVITLLFVGSLSYAQDTDSLFNRIQGITFGQGVDFFNVDGIEIALVPKAIEFTPKAIARHYKELKIKATEITTSDDQLGRTNYLVTKAYERAPGLVAYSSTWFVQDTGRTVAVSFQGRNKVDRVLARKIVLICVNKQMPPSIYQPAGNKVINFAGRQVELGGSCQWMSVNNLQCPHNGQMNWSSHKSLEGANLELEDHFRFLNAGQRGKITSDEMVDVVFEEQDVKARKLVFDFTGVTSALVGMSGGKTLTIYLVAAPVRGKFVSCVISHWNNDGLDNNGLPGLAAEVMTLK